MWQAMFEKENKLITAHDAAQAASKDTLARSGPRLHPMGESDVLRDGDNASAKSRVLWTVATDTEPML